ncbi:hypothetical protein CA54_54410 [Symmachiella macrocystis]|uniref:Uncharacterized protein n=1 Tax=Symmachiella macrocystis TaxID=2527985 RepID=A0A5C6B6X5_9PLAN|nr:hypothetical protein CA54_54410 [Symmachiella macrocystis]
MGFLFSSVGGQYGLAASFYKTTLKLADANFLASPL